MPLTIYGAQFIQDWLFGAAANTPPATLYLALYLTTPTDLGGGTEVSGGSYARVAITNNNTKWSGSTATYPSSKGNAAAFTFPASTASWGTPGWFGILDASSGGNLIRWGTLPNPVAIPLGSTYNFAIGTLLLLLQ